MPREWLRCVRHKSNHPGMTELSFYRNKEESPRTITACGLWAGPHLEIGTLGALVADQQVLAEIESREYSLITSSLNTNRSCWVLSPIGDFSVLHSPKFAEVHKLGSTHMEAG